MAQVRYKVAGITLCSMQVRELAKYIPRTASGDLYSLTPWLTVVINEKVYFQ